MVRQVGLVGVGISCIGIGCNIVLIGCNGIISFVSVCDDSVDLEVVFLDK